MNLLEQIKSDENVRNVVMNANPAHLMQMLNLSLSETRELKQEVALMQLEYEINGEVK